MNNTSAHHRYEILCLGMVVMDVLVQSPTKIPHPDTLELVNAIEFETGGGAATTARNLTKLGIPTAIAGTIGDDWLGQVLQNVLTSSEIGTTHLSVRHGEPTGASIVIISPDGERAFWHTRRGYPQYSPATLDLSLYPSVRHIHLGGVPLILNDNLDEWIEWLSVAKQNGLTVSIDPTYGPPEELAKITNFLPYTDIITPSLAEARVFTAQSQPLDAINYIEQLGAKFVCIKAGAQGAFYKDESHQLQQIKPPPVNIKDTTGAGEAFVAGLLYQWLQKQTLHKSVLFATVCGALACTKIGGPPAMPSLADAIHVWEAENQWLDHLS